MLTELKRCNSVGNIDGILFLVSIIAGKENISKDEIRNRCSLENNIIVNCPGAIAFFDYLGLIKVSKDEIEPLAMMNAFIGKDKDSIIKDLASFCISRLIDDGIFDKESTGFNPEKGQLTLKRSTFPLTYAAIRNFLTSAGVLNIEENGEICVSGAYENDWTDKLRTLRKKLTIEQLKKQQEEQSQRGLEAEKFVLSIEKERLPQKESVIKRISDFDVAAGYDIVSFSSDLSKQYDRFIEVKCYIGSPHFYWSENELDVAKLKADKYVLCLVDYTRIKEPGYLPEFISNPYSTIFESEEWLVNSASYRVQKV